jgi:hypothetical protein
MQFRSPCSKYKCMRWQFNQQRTHKACRSAYSTATDNRACGTTDTGFLNQIPHPVQQDEQQSQILYVILPSYTSIIGPTICTVCLLCTMIDGLLHVLSIYLLIIGFIGFFWCVCRLAASRVGVVLLVLLYWHITMHGQQNIKCFFLYRAFHNVLHDYKHL